MTKKTQEKLYPGWTVGQDVARGRSVLVVFMAHPPESLIVEEERIPWQRGALLGPRETVRSVAPVEIV